MSKQRTRRLKRWIAVAVAIAMAGCGPTEPRSMKSEYAMEIVGYEAGSRMQIVRVTNMTTGRSLKVLRDGKGGLITLPGEF